MRKQRSQEYRGYRSAGIRLSEEWAPELRDVRQEGESARPELLQGYHAFDKAHLVMLAEEGIIPRRDAVLMLQALREMEREGAAEVRRRGGGGMHSGEYYLIRKLGEEVGGREHLARSSGDLGAVATRIVERDKLLALMEAINRFRGVVLKEAAEHVETVMPGYFHWQHAQPVTLGHHLLSWAYPLERDFQRALEAYRRVNLSPAGGVILTGSNFPIHRRRTAELLGFDGPQVNTMDAIQSADLTLDGFTVVTILASDLSRFAEDLALWAGNEYDYVEMADRYNSGSSILMQMKTPTPPMYIRGAVGGAAGGLIDALFAAKNPTGMGGFVRPSVTAQLWNAFDAAIHHLTMLCGVLQTIKVNRELMLERAGMYYATATDIAGALVREKGLPWRTAHQIVGILMRHCEERRIKPHQLTPQMLDEAALEYFEQPVGLSEESLRRALDPVEFIRSRTLLGGPAPQEALRQIKELESALEQDHATLAQLQERVQAGVRKLEAAIDALLANP